MIKVLPLPKYNDFDPIDSSTELLPDNLLSNILSDQRIKRLYKWLEIRGMKLLKRKKGKKLTDL